VWGTFIQSHIRPLSDMPRRHEGCDHVAADLVLMRTGYRTLYTSDRVIGMGSEHPASVIFLDCARHGHHPSGSDLAFFSMKMSETQVRSSWLLWSYFSNRVSASCGLGRCHLSILRVPYLVKGRDGRHRTSNKTSNRRLPNRM